jgi:aspartyl aminopeptidase
MHSIREMCGADDFKHCVDLCRAFHKQWSKLEEKWNID